MENNKESKKNTLLVVLLVICILITSGVFTIFIVNKNKENNDKNILDSLESSDKITINSPEELNLTFLQLSNEEKNKVYSPLSVKYALGMLAEGTEGKTKSQILNVIGEYETKKYINNQNMSFANALFIKNTYKDSVNNNYITSLNEKYNADVKIDSFSSPDTINSWISNKTLGLVNNIVEDVSSKELILINALAINMEWENKFLTPSTAKGSPGKNVSYINENFWWSAGEDMCGLEFNNSDNHVSALDFIASFNNYDIVNVIGENNIRETVKKEFLEYLNNNPERNLADNLRFLYNFKYDTEGMTEEEMLEKYLDKYIEQLDSNYKREDKSTDFSFYVDEKVKVFAKDLKEYDGTTLQYIGIMPINEKLNNYIDNTNISNINKIISSLKELKLENFKDGVVTKIVGFVPKFKFDYSLDLTKNLKKIGITDVFESGKADLTNISSDSTLYINDAIHNSNIEFTQDGIKASASTLFGGAGAGGGFFHYSFDVPVEEIDLTIDKPFLFIIKDKNTNEIWFVGTVYDPLPYSEDTTRNLHSTRYCNLKKN